MGGEAGVIDPGRVRWSAPPDQRSGRPILIILHGHGMNESIGVELWEQLPPELLIVGLRGPLKVGGGYGWFRLDDVDPHEVNRAATSVLGWLDGLGDPTGTGGTSVGILGFSQGSAVALQCLRLRPERFAYAVALSSFMLPTTPAGDRILAEQRPPAFAARGGRDLLVPQFLATWTDQWLADHTTLTRHHYPDLGHSVSAQEVRDLSAFLSNRLARRKPDEH